jgi:hypothetical protein
MGYSTGKCLLFFDSIGDLIVKQEHSRECFSKCSDTPKSILRNRQQFDFDKQSRDWWPQESRELKIRMKAARVKA